jgi:hypothetical protein
MSRDKSFADEDNKITTPIPVIFNKRARDNRKCERYNYIPHNAPAKTNRCEWHNAYKNQIMDMYYILTSVINEIFPRNNINWNNIAIAHNLSRLIYHCSSKYIDDSVKVKYYEIENESKDSKNDIKDGKS